MAHKLDCFYHKLPQILGNCLADLMSYVTKLSLSWIRVAYYIWSRMRIPTALSCSVSHWKNFEIGNLVDHLMRRISCIHGPGHVVVSGFSIWVWTRFFDLEFNYHWMIRSHLFHGNIFTNDYHECFQFTKCHIST